ncbi:MAG: tRNA (adenosine(37)-N6)-dimethylallyltransferase MiaA [Candidatus Kerfeldbacteria bacterium]|nr:tRNA (adenosine(37)-N6)-dimethylallyltransferase MiaA [Candidatus Kerfeldbacteria bacterium]
MPRRLVIILGPTASGKSKLGLQLAKKFQGVVISADSRQVYRGLNIGTGKINQPGMRGVPHYLLDVASPRRQYSVARYARDVRRVLNSIDPNRPVFLVGGSPFYIKAVTEPHSFSPVPPDAALRRRLAGLTTARLIARLQKLDPERARHIDPANRRRLIRAVEIAGERRQYYSLQFPPMQVLKIGLAVPRRMLFGRIDRQVKRRLRGGMINEVQRLHRRGVPWSRFRAFGLEYRLVVDYLRGRLRRERLGPKMKSATHDFARRQMTWWKRDSGIHWVRRLDKAERLVSRFLRTSAGGRT